jgi:hypothetical protein
MTGNTLTDHYLMSALPPKADIGGREFDVRFVPKADIGSAPNAFVPRRAAS